MPGSLVDRAQAERHEHQRHAQFERVGNGRGHLGAEHDEHGSGCYECQRMSESPTGPEPRGFGAAPLARHECRDGSEMIGFERVAHPEQRAEAGAGDEFEKWHNGANRPLFYVNLLLIAIGGGLGSVARYLLTVLVLRASDSLFPLGTFVVNFVGCAVFGGIVGAAQQRFVLMPDARTFVLVGFLGGLTTFSSYAYESVALLRDGQFVLAAINIVGQVVAGLLGLWAAFKLTS